jgi:hypothetical protein
MNSILCGFVSFMDFKKAMLALIDFYYDRKTQIWVEIGRWRRWKELKRINWLHVLFKTDFYFQPLDFDPKAIDHSHHSHICLSFSCDMASIYILIEYEN